MTGPEQIPALTSGLDHWEVTLKSGAVLNVRAHAFAERDGFHVFVALMEGTPRYEYELVRVPTELIEEVEGGWLEPKGTASRDG